MKRTATPQAAPFIGQKTETDEAREDVAQRIERLARKVRGNTTATVAQLDEAYALIVKLAATLNQVLA